jgi:hypothetical protein
MFIVVFRHYDSYFGCVHFKWKRRGQYKFEPSVKCGPNIKYGPEPGEAGQTFHFHRKPGIGYHVFE